MKDKLSIGMFIRTPLGIDKIECFNKENVIGYGFITKANHYLFWHKELDEFSIDGECFEKEEIKTSFNIIDLIEVGDYVNGYYVSKIWFENEITHYIDDKPIKRKERQITIQAPSYGGIVHLKNEEIKSIVTKEQFESMKYRLGDDK